MQEKYIILRNTKVQSKYDVVEVDYITEDYKYIEKELSFEQAVGVVESYKDQPTWEI